MIETNIRNEINHIQGDESKETGKSFEECFKRFRRSKTFQMLYDEQTGLWTNGPVYVRDLYEEYN